MDELREKIARDLRIMGIKIRSPIILRAYSKTLWGYYDAGKDIIVMYVYSDKSRRRLIHYNIFFRKLLHEYVHLLQRKSSTWVRYKGIMHDAEFWRIYNYLVDIAVERGIIYGARKNYAV